MRTARQDGIRIILGACAVAAWTDLVVARQPEAPLPANLDVDPMFQVVVQGMRQRSPAFRRQIARIEAAQPFRVRVLPEDRVRRPPELMRAPSSRSIAARWSVPTSTFG